MFSDPVGGKDFFDRKPILDLLAKRINDLKGGYRKNIGLLGQELLGKTSLVQQLLTTLKDPQILPIYIEVEPEPFAHFVHQFIGNTLYSFLKSTTNDNELRGKDLSYLVKAAVKSLPETIKITKKIEASLKEKLFDQAYFLVLDLVSVLQEETGKKIIVVLDEFHRLNDFRLGRPFADFGKKIMIQKNIMYILASSNVSLARDILHEKLSLLFGNFEIIELKPFDFKTSKKFLEQRFGEINIPDIYKNFLVFLTGGHPFYLDVMSSGLRKTIFEKKLDNNPLELISRMLESEIFNSRGILYQYLTSLINRFVEKRGFATYVSILLALAEGNHKISEIARAMQKKPADISKQIAKLIEVDFVKRYGIFYNLNDPLLAFWLRSVYRKRKMSFDPEIFSKSNAFKEDVKRIIQDFANEFRRGLPERVNELFTLFKNETIEMRGRKCKFPLFSEVTSKKIHGLGLPIVARQGNKYWVGQIEDKRVEENKVIDFIQQCKKTKYKIQRKILITLGEMEINARLLAKEEKIWVWDSNDLNLLFRLYGKSPLIGNGNYRNEQSKNENRGGL